MSRSFATSAPGPKLEDCRWLTTPAAAEHLAWAASSPLELAARLARLRRLLSPERARLVVELVTLRVRAAAKFSLADRMFFTPRALEQASDEVVAAYKAERFSPAQSIIDLCCGIGGDFLALARRGPTRGCDRDAILVTLADANGRVALAGDAGGTAQVAACDAEDLDVADCAAWHIDPDRRPEGRRTTRVELHEPGPHAIERLLARNPNGAVKLAPAARLPDGWQERAELEWIGHARECRQLVAWFGALARDASKRRATVVGRRGAARSLVGEPASAPPIAERIEQYVFEPDAAVLAAHLEGPLAAEHCLAAIAKGVAYWTGSRPIDDPALARFEVLEVLPLRAGPLAGLLRARDVGQLEIKKRGVDLDPQELRRKLKPSGSNAATLLVTTIDKRVTAIVARRVTASSA